MKYLLTIIIPIIICVNTFSEPVINLYQYKIKDQLIAKYRIYLNKDLLFCTGKDQAGLNNNTASQMILDGDYEGAKEKLLFNLKMSPLFLPTQYNLGIAYIYLNDLDRAIFHLNKAQQIFPEFYATYIQLGYIYDRRNRLDKSLDYYRKSLKLHHRNLKVYTLMGDIYFNRKQYRMALKYYNESLRIDKNYANGILGEAKILFINEKYLKAINKLKSINRGDEYDITYHYYLAECSYKIGDYKTAYDEYKKLLEFKSDRFFLTNSHLLIQHKMNLARRFTER